MAQGWKDRLIFDPADLAESDNMGAYVRAGSDGDLISSTLESGKEGLDVYLINPSIVVTGTDIDIRDITHVSDSIKVGDGVDFLAVNNDGSINVNLTDDGIADDAPDSGNPFLVGGHAFDGALGAVSDDDRVYLSMDLYRRVYINDSCQIEILSQAVTVGATAIPLPATALAGRRKLTVQNTSNNDIFVGGSAVTVGDGTRIAKGSSWSFNAGEFCILYAIASGAGNSVRVLEEA
jgi:hypothetical protein